MLSLKFSKCDHYNWSHYNLGENHYLEINAAVSVSPAYCCDPAISTCVLGPCAGLLRRRYQHKIPICVLKSD